MSGLESVIHSMEGPEIFSKEYSIAYLFCVNNRPSDLLLKMTLS